MNHGQRISLARTIGLAAGCVVLIGIVFLVVDYTRTRLLDPIEKERVKAMEEAVRMDAAVSVELTAERDRQTLHALDREARNRIVRIVLIVGSAIFLVAANCWLSLRGDFNILNWGRGAWRRHAPLMTVTRTAVPHQPAEAVTGSPSGQLVILQVEPDLDLRIVDRIVAQEGRSREAAIPILAAIQASYGFLPDEALQRVCRLTEITPAQIAGTSTFYAQFRRSPVGKHIVKVCHGTACHVSGIVQIDEELRRRLQIPGDADTDPSRLFTLEKVACLGCCSLAPVIMIGERTVGRLTPSSACEALDTAAMEQVT